MRENWTTRIVGEKVVLVPYRRCHVPKYHEWMKDPFLLEMTASEPLSLEEEYEMQASWRDDPSKCTFMLLDVMDKRPETLDSQQIEHMAGDTNLFFNEEGLSTAEIEIMVAEPSARKKGIATEALTMLIRYAHQQLQTKTFVAKISDKNEASLSLFESKLGFVRKGFCDAFNEFTLELCLDELSQEQKAKLNFDKALTIMPDFDVQSPVYETPELVDQYLALHFGQAPSVVAQTLREPYPLEALEFPKRCAQWVCEIAAQIGIPINDRRKGTKALDLGCAVGGSSFELSKSFSFVRGVDNSSSFVAMAKQIRDHPSSFQPLTFQVPVEAGKVRKGIPVTLEQGVDRARVEFETGDACNLGDAGQLGGPFDAVLLANLLCRVPDPVKLLRDLPRLLKEHAVVVIVSPYTWMEEYTSLDKWLVPPGDSRSCDERLVELMEELGFHLQGRRDMPLIIREHDRKYQYVISSGMAFTK